MNRRTYLRTLGAAVGTATLASAGATAAEGDSIPEAVRQAPVGASDARVSDPPTDAIDVRDYGAQLDGSTDDRDAIQEAIDAAAQSGTSNTVFVPEGTVRMSGTLRFYPKHNGVTLQGSGSGTHLRLDEGFGSNHRLIYVGGSSGGVKDLTVRDLRLDGQGAGQNDQHGWGVVTFDDAENLNILLENLWVHDWAGTNLQIGGRATTVKYVSSWGAKDKQGIATHNGTSSNPIMVEGSHFYDNSVHGINASHGHTVVQNVLSEGNGWGAKNTPKTDVCEWKQVVFRDNNSHGYMLPSSTQGDISFDDIVAEKNGRCGFKIVENSSVSVGTIAARANNQAGHGGGNIHVGGSINLNADTVYSFDSPMAGLVFNDYSNDPSVNIDTYVHGGNDEAISRRGSSLSISDVRSGEFPDINPLGGDSIESLNASSDSRTSTALPVTDGLVLSLDASEGVSTNDETVTDWADQSGQGNDLTANGDPTLATAPSGAQTISFDGSGDELVRTGELSGLPTGSESRTVVVVAKYESTGFGGVTYGSPASNDAFGTVVNDEGELAVQGWSGQNDYSSGVAGTGAGWLTQSVTYDGSEFVHYENGEQIDSGTHSFTTKDDKLAIGAELSTPPYLDMQVGAVAVYDRSLSDDERQQVQQHLQNQYLSNL